MKAMRCGGMSGQLAPTNMQAKFSNRSGGLHEGSHICS